MNKTHFDNQWLKEEEKLLHYATYLCKSKDQAKDMVQDLYLKSTSRLHQLKEDKKLSIWLKSSLYRMFIDGIRSKKSISYEDVNWEEAAEERIRCMDNSLFETLNAKEKEIMESVYVKDISQRLLAENYGMSYSGLKSKVQRIRLKIKDWITECCEVSHDVYGNILHMEPRNGKCKMACNCV